MSKVLSYKAGAGITYATNSENSLVKRYIAGEAITAGMAVSSYLDGSVIKIKPALAREDAPHKVIGIANASGAAGTEIHVTLKGNMILAGLGTGVTEFPTVAWLSPTVPGQIIFEIEPVAGDVLAELGVVISENEMMVEMGDYYIVDPTENSGGNPGGGTPAGPVVVYEDTYVTVNAEQVGTDVKFIFTPKLSLNDLVVNGVNKNGAQTSSDVRLINNSVTSDPQVFLASQVLAGPIDAGSSIYLTISYCEGQTWQWYQFMTTTPFVTV